MPTFVDPGSVYFAVPPTMRTVATTLPSRVNRTEPATDCCVFSETHAVMSTVRPAFTDLADAVSVVLLTARVTMTRAVPDEPAVVAVEVGRNSALKCGCPSTGFPTASAWPCHPRAAWWRESLRHHGTARWPTAAAAARTVTVAVRVTGVFVPYDWHGRRGHELRGRTMLLDVERNVFVTDGLPAASMAL